MRLCDCSSKTRADGRPAFGALIAAKATDSAVRAPTADVPVLQGHVKFCVVRGRNVSARSASCIGQCSGHFVAGRSTPTWSHISFCSSAHISPSAAFSPLASVWRLITLLRRSRCSSAAASDQLRLPRIVGGEFARPFTDEGFDGIA